VGKIRLHTDRCKGCRLCVGACPKQAVIPLDEVNKKGYEITAVDEDKCIACGSCYKICPDYVYEIGR
jgi:2-oxoglutarate ferredoxin oxidoreductase subunit delta